MVVVSIAILVLWSLGWYIPSPNLSRLPNGFMGSIISSNQQSSFHKKAGGFGEMIMSLYKLNQIVAKLNQIATILLRVVSLLEKINRASDPKYIAMNLANGIFSISFRKKDQSSLCSCGKISSILWSCPRLCYLPCPLL